MTQLQKEILKTIYFFSLYDVQPRQGDLYVLTQSKGTEEEFKKALDVLVAEKQLVIDEPFVGLPGQEGKGRKEFLKRKPYIDMYWKKVRKHGFWWQFSPFVRGVFVGNSLAMGTAHEESDIDLFVVTAKNRMFFARACLSLWIHIMGNRRHGVHVKGRFCLSFWVPEDHLSLEAIKLGNDPYLHYWLATLKPVYGKETYKALLRENKPIMAQFPNRPAEYRKELLPQSPVIRFWREFWEKFLEITVLASLFEFMCKKYQLKRARKKYTVGKTATAVVIEEHILKFHEKDTREEIAKELAEV